MTANDLAHELYRWFAIKGAFVFKEAADALLTLDRMQEERDRLRTRVEELSAENDRLLQHIGREESLK